MGGGTEGEKDSVLGEQRNWAKRQQEEKLERWGTTGANSERRELQDQQLRGKSPGVKVEGWQSTGGIQATKIVRWETTGGMVQG